MSKLAMLLRLSTFFVLVALSSKSVICDVEHDLLMLIGGTLEGASNETIQIRLIRHRATRTMAV